MKRKKFLAHICAFTLTAGIIAFHALPVSAAAVTEETAVNTERETLLDAAGDGQGTESDVQGPESDEQEHDDGRIYVNGTLYNGYYMDNSGIMYFVSAGVPEVKTGTAGQGTEYYSSSNAGMMTLQKQTLYVKGTIYTGYYTGPNNNMYLVKNGVRTIKTGTLKAGTEYYSYNDGKTRTLSKQRLYVKGKIYTGYYMGPKNNMYRVKNGVRTIKTGTLKAGTKYYSYNKGKTRTLSKQRLYVKGKIYTGYYLGPKNNMNRVKNGLCTMETGILDAGTRYYSYNGGKTLKLSKQTLYVKGKIYTGYYRDRENNMYCAADGTLTPVNTALNAGTRYYDFNAGKRLTLSNMMVYVNGKAMEGMSPESLATLQRAQSVVAGITNDSMSQEEKLKVCFDFVKTYRESNPRIPHYTGMDWPVIYANDMFVNGIGNCCSYAAAFAYMAKAIGYEEVYCCNSGGHGWAEIDGLVYDPEWSIHYHVYSYYALSYDTKTDQNYKGAIGAGKPWMHIKI